MKIYDDLYLFYICAKSPSFSAAAKKLKMDQSSLSCAISRLEKRLDTKLFIRRRTGLELTDSGLRIYQRISKNYSDLSGLLSEVFDKDTHSKHEELKIITTTGILSTILIDVIEKFRNDFPDISINLETHEGPVNFSKTNADVGILPTVVDSEAVKKRKIITLKSRMFCSNKYIEKYSKPKSLDDLKKHKFIGYYNSLTGYKGNVDWHLKYSATGEADIKINLASSQLYAADKGLGILAIPQEIPMSDNMNVLFPEEYVAIDVFAITRREEASAKVDNFIECAKKHMVNLEMKNEKN